MPAPGPIFVTVAASASGLSAVSSAFALPRGERPLIVVCPSNGTASSVQLQFTTSSGGTIFAAMARLDGSGVPIAVYSASTDGFGYHPAPPTAWARISLSAQPLATMSFTILERA